MSKKSLSLTDLPVHPVAEMYPLMPEDAYEEFKEDIRLHGQYDDIIVSNGVLIDGRHRLRACLELGIEPRWSELPKSENAKTWIASHNQHRRHMTTGQRAMTADKIVTWELGENQHSKEGDGIPSPSQSDAAKLLNVSRDSVRLARRVRKHASKRVIEAVESGALTLNAAVETTLKKSAAEKAAKAKAAAEKAAKAQKKAEETAARQKERAERAAAKAEAKAQKEKARLAKEAAKAASQTKEGQIKNLRNMIKQHIDNAARLACDLHRLKPNLQQRQLVVKLIQDAGVNLW